MLYLGVLLVWLGLCLKVSSLPLESSLVSLLEPDSECSIVLLDVQSLFVEPCLSAKNFVENMQVMEATSKPIIVLDDSAIADTSKINTMSKCFIGISDIKAVNSLQQVLFPTRNRQLIGITSSNVSVQAFTVNVTVNKKQHPIMLLNENKAGVKQSLLCHEKVIDINLMKNSKWSKKPIFDSLTFERLCNNGNHPLKHKSLATTFIVMGFSGNLKSSFIRQNYEDRTLTLNGMVDKDITIHTSTELIEYLELTKLISEINSRILCQAHKKDSVFVTGPDSMTVLLDEVMNNGGAFMVNQHTLEYSRALYLLTGTDFPLVRIPERYSAFSMGMLFQKFDPRVQYFDEVIGQITDTGIIDGYFRKALPYSNLLYHDKVEEHPLILEHFVISMIVYLVGLFLGGLVFATEMGKTCKSKRVHKFLEDKTKQKIVN